MRRRGSAQARAWAELPERGRRQCLAVTADAGYGADPEHLCGLPAGAQHDDGGRLRRWHGAGYQDHRQACEPAHRALGRQAPQSRQCRGLAASRRRSAGTCIRRHPERPAFDASPHGIRRRHWRHTGRKRRWPPVPLAGGSASALCIAADKPTAWIELQRSTRPSTLPGSHPSQAPADGQFLPLATESFGASHLALRASPVTKNLSPGGDICMQASSGRRPTARFRLVARTHAVNGL